MQGVVRVVEAYEAELMTEVEAGRMSEDEFSQKLVAYSNAVMSRILQSDENREMEEDIRPGGSPGLEDDRSIEEAERGGDEASSTLQRKDNRRSSISVEGVEPRFVPEEEYKQVEAERKRQVAAGEISEDEAWRELVKLQNANTMAHIEQSVREGETTRAEADALYERLGIR